MTHIVQTQEWADFKNNYGTKAVRSSEIFYTLHKIPFSGHYFAYCPKVDPQSINFEELKASLLQNDCININFDVPMVVKGTDSEETALEVFKTHNCVNSPRTQFAASNVILDISKTDEELLQQMHTKHRYNIGYAQKKGVTITMAQTEVDFDEFYMLLRDTAKRQHYFIRPREYYFKVWEMLSKKDMCFILTAKYENTPLASWMFFIYENTLYYPYGGSSESYKNLHGSTLLAWEGIRVGKQRSCKTFDMWGACEDLKNEKDPWFGFTNFKLKFGGTYIKYMDSYDYVVNQSVYTMFTLANDLRWKLLGVLR